MVVCSYFRVAIFKSAITLAIFFFSAKILSFSNKLNKWFRDSLILKHFLTALKFVLSYCGLLFVLNEIKTSFNSFIYKNIFFIILCVWFKTLVNEFKEFQAFMVATFVKNLLNSYYISLILAIFLFSTKSVLYKLYPILRILPVTSFITRPPPLSPPPPPCFLWVVFKI